MVFSVTKADEETKYFLALGPHCPDQITAPPHREQGAKGQHRSVVKNWFSPVFLLARKISVQRIQSCLQIILHALLHNFVKNLVFTSFPIIYYIIVYIDKKLVSSEVRNCPVLIIEFLKMLTVDEKLCLQWNDFKENISSAFGDLRQDNEFTDVTLACEDGQQMEAHKAVLIASSSFFLNILQIVFIPCRYCAKVFISRNTLRIHESGHHVNQ